MCRSFFWYGGTQGQPQNGDILYNDRIVAPCASSRNIPSRFATSSTVWKFTPVAFRPAGKNGCTKMAEEHGSVRFDSRSANS